MKKSIKDAKLKINNINNDIDSLSKERFEIAQSVDSLQSQYDTKVEFYKQESKSLSENHKKLYANYEKKSQEIIDLENQLIHSGNIDNLKARVNYKRVPKHSRVYLKTNKNEQNVN